MSLLKRKQPRVITMSVTGLPITPVFEQGLIVFARSFDDGMRVVTFEEPFVRSGTKIQSYHGKGESIDAALAQALHFFHAVDVAVEGTFATHLRDRGPAHVRNLNSRLDTWLAEHNGSMHAVGEDDGTVLVRLEGRIDPSKPGSRHVTLEASGVSYYSALAAVLNKYSKYSQTVKKLAVASA